MQRRTILGVIFAAFPFFYPAYAQHPPGWTACEFKWQEAGRSDNYQGFMRKCVAANVTVRTGPASAPSAINDPLEGLPGDDPAQVTEALRSQGISASSINSASFGLGSAKFTDLANCAVSARSVYKASAIETLRNECAREYRDWFATCAPEQAKACGLIALFIVQTTIDGYDVHCNGSAEESARLGCPKSASPQQTEAPVVATASKDHSFDRIFEYTLFDKALPDGKHPTWVYFASRSGIIKVEMPSLDSCVVTSNSQADRGVIASKNYDEIAKGSGSWDFAIEIWNAAFSRYMIVGKPKSC